MTKEEFFNRYKFDTSADLLGSGSFGAVYKAYDTVLDTWVAVKISPVSAGKSRLRHEVELVSHLKPHPNVASYTDCYTFSDPTGDFDIAVLQYYEAGSLEDMLRPAKLSPSVNEEVIRQIIDGLEFLHSNGIIHRDLKPANILMARRPDGTLVPKIADFGISCDESLNGDDTVAEAATISYAAPEQLRGEDLTAASDIWSLGVIAYRTITGQLPFETPGSDTSSLAGKAEVINRITAGKLPENVDSLPAPWNIFVAEALKVNPAERADITTLRHALDNIPPFTPPPFKTDPPKPDNIRINKVDPVLPPLRQKRATWSWKKVLAAFVVVCLIIFIPILIINYTEYRNKKSKPIPPAPTFHITTPEIETGTYDEVSDSVEYTPAVEEAPAVEEDYSFVDTVAAVDEAADVYADSAAAL